MPTYQYACTSCGEQTEAVQRFTDDPLTVCPVCGGALRKVFSPVGIVFKGSGFYRTDSRNGSGPSGEKAAAKSNGDSSAGDGKDGKASSDTGSSSSNGKSSDGASSGSTSSGDTKPASKKPAGAGSSS